MHVIENAMCLPSWQVQKVNSSNSDKPDVSYKVTDINSLCLTLFNVSDLAHFQLFFNTSILPALTGEHFLEQLFNDKPNRCARKYSISNDGKQFEVILILSTLEGTKPLLDISVIDITELESSQQELSVSKHKLEETLERYELVFEGAHGGIWDWDIVKETVHFSESWCQLRKGTKSDFTNDQSEWLNTIHPDDKDRVIAAVDAHFRGETPFFEEEYRIICRDGSFRWVSDRGIVKRNEQGEPIRMAGSERDITTQILAAKQQQLAASLFENISESAIILDPQGNIINLNQAFSQTFGYEKEKLLNKPFIDIFNSEQKMFITGLIKRNYKTWSDEIAIMHHDRHKVLCKLNMSSVVDQNGDLTHFVCLISDITENKRTEKLLYNLAYQDNLTALPNRLSLNERLMELVHQANYANQYLAVLFLDLDNFKYVNDGLGHEAGDQLLKNFADTITQSIRKEDFVARLGGDEFVVVLSNINDAEDITVAAEQLLSNLKYRVLIQNKEVTISASIGISVYPNDGIDAGTLIQNADAAMYQAKDCGKQNFQYYTPHLTQKAVERVILEADIDRAIAQSEFVLFYQPQICIQTRVTKGVEALIRWQPPGKEMIFPDRFISLAEENGTIIAIGHWVLHQACKQAKSWLDNGLNFGVVSVNVSAKQLQSDDLIASIQSALDQSQLPAHCLELEITESFILQQPLTVIDRLEKIRAIGVSIAIDDFGTGYSSLSYLKKLPAHCLKIDRSFVMDIPEDENDVAITEAIIVMANKLGLDIVAEGVENEEQASFLLEKGCQKAQGYYFSKPLSFDKVCEYLAER